MSKKKAVQHAIEDLYGPCPTNDFVRANEWASHLDWVSIKEHVEKEHPDFDWPREGPQDKDPAEALITQVRHEMLHRAGEAE